MANPFDDPRDRLLAAFIAFQAAHKRFAENSPKLSTCFAPLTEALWWAVSVDEGFEDDLAANGYEDAKSSDDDGRLLHGIRYARNRGGHQRALTTAQHLALAPPDASGLSFGLPIAVVVWRQFSELPPPGRRDENGAHAYRQYLEGHQVDETLRRVSAWFGKAGAAYL